MILFNCERLIVKAPSLHVCICILTTPIIINNNVLESIITIHYYGSIIKHVYCLLMYSYMKFTVDANMIRGFWLKIIILLYLGKYNIIFYRDSFFFYIYTTIQKLTLDTITFFSHFNFINFAS